MNLETLKKYWNELEHYKNGGSLLARIWITDDNDGDESYTIWYKVGCECWDINKVYNYTLDYHKVQIIINDEYSIYRKALVEGKTVQANINYWSFPETEEFNWQDIASPDSFNKFNLINLRIKPNEPKFKVGDFVRYVHSTQAIALEINNINGNRYYFTNSEMSCLKHELEPWTPIKNEWCWFYYNPDNKYSHLAQFYDMNISEDNSLSTFMSSPITKWKCCEPFLNSRPSYLKDK